MKPVKTSLEKFNADATGGVNLLRSNETYDVLDLNMEHLILSVTILHPGKETGGHEHEDKEEIYIFQEGTGKIQVGEHNFEVNAGDIITIPSKHFHKVWNTGETDLKFLAIFEKYERSE